MLAVTPKALDLSASTCGLGPHEGQFWGAQQTLKACAREGLDLMGLPYPNQVLDAILHSLFLLSCPAAPDLALAATLQGCCEVARSRKYSGQALLLLPSSVGI